MPINRITRCRDSYRCPLCGFPTLEGEHMIELLGTWREEPTIGCRVRMVVHRPKYLGTISSMPDACSKN